MTQYLYSTKTGFSPFSEQLLLRDHSYDPSTKTWTTRTPLGRTSLTVLDSYGRIITRQVAGLIALAFAYDASGRLSSVVQGERALTWDHDSNGNVSSATDSMSRTYHFSHDELGRLTSQTLADGRVMSFAYDQAGNLSSVSPPDRSAHEMIYSPVNLMASYQPPSIGQALNATNYSYNADRQLTDILSTDGHSIHFDYDVAGRVSGINDIRGRTSYVFEASTGNLVSIIAPGNQTLGFAYDGSLLTNLTYGGTVSGTVARTYNNNFDVASESINGANTIVFGYDADQLLISAGPLVLTRNEQNGLVARLALASSTESMTYNGYGELMSQAASYAGAQLVTFTYARNELGRIVGKQEDLAGMKRDYTYTYDVSGRLESVIQDGITVESYTYDGNSNRLTVVTASGITNATFDAQDQLLRHGDNVYTYSSWGELLTRTSPAGITSYVHDGLANLTQVMTPDGRNIEFVIDGMNRRVGKKVNGQLVRGFIFSDQLRVVAEVDGTNQAITRFVYGSRPNIPDYMVKNGIIYRIISDQIGSPRLVVNTSTGEISQQMTYDVWGKIISDTNPGFQPFAFAGGLYDQDTGLVRFGARDYDPEVGRWTSKDPLRFSAGDSNVFRYGVGDPVNMIDLTGENALSAVALFFGARETVESINESILSAFLGAPYHFIKNYKKMHEKEKHRPDGAPWNDKYYHCMANCESAQLGIADKAAAYLMSEAKEFYDEKLAPKSKRSTPEMCNEDRAANALGRRTPGDCTQTCAPLRPSWAR